MKRFLFISILLALNLDAALLIESEPTTSIQGVKSKLAVPEGVTFSPSGDYLAVANYGGSTTTFYRRKENSGSHYESTPFYVLKVDESEFKVAHDVAISPDGQLLAVAYRETHKVAFYEKNGPDEPFNWNWKSRISPKPGKLKVPSAVAFSPMHNFVVVASCGKREIAFFRYEKGHVDEVPYFILGTPDRGAHLDGLAISPDGKLLVAVSYTNHKVFVYRQSQKNPYQYDPDSFVIEGNHTCLFYPHSAAFHPSGKYLFVTNAGGAGSVVVFEVHSEANKPISANPVMHFEIAKTKNSPTSDSDGLGAKGIAFSSDGKSLAICAHSLVEDDSRILIYNVQELGPE